MTSPLHRSAPSRDRAASAPPRDLPRASGRTGIRRRLATLAAALALAGAPGGCATNPATGERQLSLVSESEEIALGRQADAEVGATLGLVEDPELQAYVERVGASLAALSERPDLPWAFRVIDDAAVNAFALPGGFVYVTRGLLAYLESEAQLAAVLAHEIGHITARHAVSRLSRAQLANLGLGVGMILSPDLRRFGDVAQVGLGLLFLKYSRDDERQADDLALRYVQRGGYDPRPMAAVFTVLERVSALEQGGRVPDWLSSHPSPADRRARIDEAVAAGGPVSGAEERGSYLRRVDGLVFGPDPREGFFRGRVFLHPELRFRLEFPSGWSAVNRKREVAAVSPQQDAVVGLGLTDASSPEAAARAFAAQGGVRTGGARSGSVNGLAAVRLEFEAGTQQGVLRGLALFVRHEARVFQLLGYAPAARWAARERAVAESLGSFAPLTDPDVLGVQPMRLEIFTPERPLTPRELAGSYPSPVSAEVLAILNQTDPAAPLPAGAPAKRVTGTAVPTEVE